MQILKVPNPILKTKCQDVTDLFYIEGIVNEMIQTAKDADLVGMAANQIDILQNVFVMNMGKNWQAFINPVIKRHKEKGTKWDWEGCGSIPNLACLIERHNSITINYTSVEGENKSIELTGYLARIAQHEFDHLQGILITDKARQRKAVK